MENCIVDLYSGTLIIRPLLGQENGGQISKVLTIKVIKTYSKTEMRH